MARFAPATRSVAPQCGATLRVAGAMAKCVRTLSAGPFLPGGPNVKTTTWLLTLALLIPGAPALSGLGQAPQREPKKIADKKTDELMKRKLDSAQKVLEAVALNDFDKIAKHAEELIVISHQAEWKALMKTPEYELNSADFRRHAQDLVKSAKAKNLDGAALAYVELTMSCVRCHKHVRDVRMGRLGGEEEGRQRTENRGQETENRG